MCEEVIKCVREDLAIRAIIENIVETKLKKDILTKTISVMFILLSQYSAEITHFLKEMAK